MKDFLKYTLASITGSIILLVAIGIIGTVAVAGMVASSQSQPSVEDNSVFVLSLTGPLEERSTENLYKQLTGQVVKDMGLDDILSSIRKAKNNDKIKGIYIEAGMLSPDAPASIEAIRKQLIDFRKSGKWIVAYADTYTQGAYYLCSAADKVFLNPQGTVDLHGLGGTMMFYKDLLAKFGVKMQLAKVGKYKSAPEMFTADKMSDPNREQTQKYIDGIWDTMLNEISVSRKIQKALLNSYADSLYTFAEPNQYVSAKLVDKLLYADEAKAEVKKMLGIDEDDDINQLTLNDMTLLPTKDDKGDEIAVYYAFGDVVDTTPTGLNNRGNYIAADKVCLDLERLAEDDDVKAVVLRVNTGGGSAYASEQIWHAVTKLKERKPVVVSMGGMAASGGYYISCAANYIYAEKTTLTGSIGIFGMFPDFSGLLTDKLGVKFDEVKTNKHSAFGTLARPFNDEEMAILNTYVGRGYDLFLKRVAEGRKMTIANVDSIAQGRIWLAMDARKIKLVDAFGGLDDAVAKAAQLANIKEHHTEAYPAKPDIVEQLLEQATGSGSYLDDQARQTLGEYYEPFVLLKTLSQQNAIQARLPYKIVIR